MQRTIPSITQNAKVQDPRPEDFQRGSGVWGGLRRSLHVWVNACLIASVMSDCLGHHGLYLPGSSIHEILQARILEWVHALLQGIFLT